jgi:uncharacterized protein YdeI (YjbR/CyaY-like superfamily)
MPPVAPDPKKIKSFKTAAAFEKWMATHHARESEIWLKIHKKSSGLPTVDYAHALDVALCYGWIDGLKKSFDEQSFLQRFTPRTAKSMWSQVNREHVARLIGAGRMTPHGEKHIAAAKADGRWDAAYAPIRETSRESLPADLRAAIEADLRALQTFSTLSKQNLFALAFRTNNMKTPAGRARKIESLVAMLARGETIVPQKKASECLPRSARCTGGDERPEPGAGDARTRVAPLSSGVARPASARPSAVAGDRRATARRRH